MTIKEKDVLAVVNEADVTMDKPFSSWSRQSPSFQFAYILRELGVKTIVPGHSWWNGDNTGIENLRVHTNSVVMYPYVGVKVGRVDRPLPYYLADHFGHTFCGCSGNEHGDGYMQICITNRRKADGLLQHSELREWCHDFHTNLMINFLGMMDTKIFGVSPDRYGKRKKKKS